MSINGADAVEGEGESALRQLTVDPDSEGQRLDVFLTAHLTEHSRVQVRRAINGGAVQVDGQGAKASLRLRSGQSVLVRVPDLPREGPEPEDIPLDVLYEDDELAAVVKPAGMVVHPARGHWSGTLASALAFRFRQLSEAGGPARPGIVHRLDRDTSGVMVVAKTDFAHQRLAAQFEARTVEKQYVAIVAGVPDRDQDIIDEPIGPHPYSREKMAIRRGHDASRDARTLYEVRERFARFALLHLKPRTGRTHQIRVHLAHLGAPVLCDRLYGGRSQITAAELTGQRPSENDRVVLNRQALHAERIQVLHPRTNLPLEFSAPMPSDLEETLSLLRSAS